jgi:hypothetical protein
MSWEPCRTFRPPIQRPHTALLDFFAHGVQVTSRHAITPQLQGRSSLPSAQPRSCKGSDAVCLTTPIKKIFDSSSLVPEPYRC